MVHFLKVEKEKPSSDQASSSRSSILELGGDDPGPEKGGFGIGLLLLLSSSSFSTIAESVPWTGVGPVPGVLEGVIATHRDSGWVPWAEFEGESCSVCAALIPEPRRPA